MEKKELPREERFGLCGNVFGLLRSSGLIFAQGGISYLTRNDNVGTHGNVYTSGLQRLMSGIVVLT